MKKQIISDYMKDDEKRHALNAMAQKTFCISFESWVTDGYFDGKYIPYSMFEDGSVVSNISANIMNYNLFGEKKNFIQLGTVMTDESYRKRGWHVR